MDRSSKPLQELNSSPELQSLRRSFTSCQSKCACRVVGYMRNKNGEKRIQAERPRVQGNPPALDRDPQRLIFGYATNPLAIFNWTEVVQLTLKNANGQKRHATREASARKIKSLIKGVRSGLIFIPTDALCENDRQSVCRMRRAKGEQKRAQCSLLNACARAAGVMRPRAVCPSAANCLAPARTGR